MKTLAKVSWRWLRFVKDSFFSAVFNPNVVLASRPCSCPDAVEMKIQLDLAIFKGKNCVGLFTHVSYGPLIAGSSASNSSRYL